MTNGIIQSEIQSMIDYVDGHEPETTILKQLQQELIEKIKSYELYYLKDNGKETNFVLKLSLIGDNKE